MSSPVAPKVKKTRTCTSTFDMDQAVDTMLELGNLKKTSFLWCGSDYTKSRYCAPDPKTLDYLAAPLEMFLLICPSGFPAPKQFMQLFEIAHEKYGILADDRIDPKHHKLTV